MVNTMGFFSRIQEDRQEKKIEKLYLDGRAAVRENNMELAVKYFQEAANYGYKEALLSLIHYYEDCDIDQAYYWVRRYIEEFHLPVGNDLYTKITISYGELHHDAEAVYRRAMYMEKNSKYCDSYIFRLMEKAADLGHLDAQLYCAKEYDAGQEIIEKKNDESNKKKRHHKKKQKDPKGNTPKERALYWYLEAAKQGSAEAKAHLAKMYYNGDTVEQNNEKAYELALQAKEGGNNTESINIILNTLTKKFSYEDGLKAYQAKDYEKALPLLLEAAKLEDFHAQCLCARMYLLGLGCQQNYMIALEWYEKVAQCLNIVPLIKTDKLYSQLFYLGIAFFVDEQYDIAYDLLDNAAKQHFFHANLYLSMLYQHGTNIIPQDSQMAHFYYEKWLHFLKTGDIIYLGSFPQNDLYKYYSLTHKKISEKRWEFVAWEVMDIKDDQVLLLTTRGLILCKNNRHNIVYLKEGLFSEIEQSFVLNQGLLNSKDYNHYVNKNPSLAKPVTTTIYARSKAIADYAPNILPVYNNNVFECRYQKNNLEDDSWATSLTQLYYPWWLKDGIVSDGVKPQSQFDDNSFQVGVHRYATWIRFPKD